MRTVVLLREALKRLVPPNLASTRSLALLLPVRRVRLNVTRFL